MLNSRASHLNSIVLHLKLKDFLRKLKYFSAKPKEFAAKLKISANLFTPDGGQTLKKTSLFYMDTWTVLLSIGIGLSMQSLGTGTRLKSKTGVSWPRSDRLKPLQPGFSDLDKFRNVDRQLTPGTLIGVVVLT